MSLPLEFWVQIWPPKGHCGRFWQLEKGAVRSSLRVVLFFLIMVWAREIEFWLQKHVLHTKYKSSQDWLDLNLLSFLRNLKHIFSFYIGFSNAKHWGIFQYTWYPNSTKNVLYDLTSGIPKMFFKIWPIKNFRILVWSLTSQVPLLAIYPQEIIKDIDNNITLRMFLRTLFIIVTS